MTTNITNSQSTVNPKVTYAQMTQQVQCPTREQAIVVDSIEGISVHEYITSLAMLTSSLNIRFVSRISHRRVCFYLNTKETADSLIDKYLIVGTHELKIRPLLNKAKRIILSNVHPIIPNELIIWKN